jgi:fatty-acyl-CoA synthase
MFVPLTPIRCLMRALDQFPRKTGVVCGNARFTYAELGERCRRLAAALRGLGVREGDRVAVLGFNTHVLLEAYFAVPIIGGILVPLNVRLHPAEMTRLIEHCLPTVFLYDRDFIPLLDELRKGAPSCRFVAICEEPDGHDPSLEPLLECDPLPMPDLFSIDECSIAELFYTSGSTGLPKGVMLSHRTLYMHALGLASSLDHSDSQVVLHTIPLFHANGWGFPQFMTMCGATHVMIRRFQPADVFRLIEQERVTMMILVPTMADALTNFVDEDRSDTSSLRFVLLGGAASSHELIARMERTFPGAHILTGYGLTETTPVIATATPKGTVQFKDDETRIRFASYAGWPVVGCEVRVVDGQGQDVPRDFATIGELIVRGDNVMDGYYLSPEMTMEAVHDGWLATGDMAVWDEDGCIRIADRKKDIIISGGENIASIEVEHALAAHDQVAECAVVSAPHEKWGETPVAIVVLKGAASISSEELLAFASQRLAKFKLPGQIIFRTEPLPRTGTGKVQKTVLREPFWR